MKTILVCNHCGSPRVAFDAYYYPNTDDTVTFDYEFCSDCEGESSLKEVDVSDDFDLEEDFYKDI